MPPFLQNGLKAAKPTHNICHLRSLRFPVIFHQKDYRERTMNAFPKKECLINQESLEKLKSRIQTLTSKVSKLFQTFPKI